VLNRFENNSFRNLFGGNWAPNLVGRLRCFRIGKNLESDRRDAFQNTTGTHKSWLLGQHSDQKKGWATTKVSWQSGILLFATRSRPAQTALAFSVQPAMVAVTPGGMGETRKPTHYHLSSAEGKNAWNYTYISRHVFIRRCLITHRHSSALEVAFDWKARQ